MNTDILLAGEGSSPRLAAGFDAAHDLICEGEARFSRFLDDSELSRLNRAAGSWFPASPEMYAVLALAQRYHRTTRGLFDPSILPDLKRVGYDRSMDLIRAQGDVPPATPAVPQAARPAFSLMQLDPTLRQVWLPAGMALDLGGIAKGWIAEQAALELSEYAQACVVNAGGDMYLSGHPDGRRQWPVALEDPRQPGRILANFSVEAGGVATSSMAKRTWIQASASGPLPRHHLIDPRSGEPARGDWLSVTVVAPHTHLAEVIAKALLIGGPLEADRLVLNEISPFYYITVDRDGQLSGTHPILEIPRER